MKAPKKPKYVPPEYVPTPRSELARVPCKGGPVKFLWVRQPIPTEHKVLDVGTYLLLDGKYVFTPNPDSPTRKFERAQTADVV